ncbi:MAG: hypothetical protein ACQUHE_16755 [Bacteroidia bacterium]
MNYNYVICFVKPIALLLVACILMLSSLQGNGANMRSSSVSDCCKEGFCKHGKQTNQNNGCDGKACSRMVSCSQCGFIISEQLLFQDIITLSNGKSIPLATIGVVTGYTQIGWHPPKV